MSERFSHLKNGKPHMVDVTAKESTQRMARAQSVVILGEDVLNQLEGDEIHVPKGPVFQTAVLAGILAAKKTGELLPLCHPLPLSHCDIHIEVIQPDRIRIESKVRIDAKTGVEMEALTAVSIAALTVYDMCKALSQDIRITETMLLEKKGGKKDFIRTP